MVGLRGTGSKDVIVKDVQPTYRTMDAMKVMDGTAQREAGMTETFLPDAVVDDVPLVSVGTPSASLRARWRRR